MTRPATQRIAAAAAAVATRPQDSFGPGCGVATQRPQGQASPPHLLLLPERPHAHQIGRVLTVRQHHLVVAAQQTRRFSSGWKAAPKLPWAHPGPLAQSRHLAALRSAQAAASLPAAQARAAQRLLVPSWAIFAAPKPVSLRVALFLRNAEPGKSFPDSFWHACMQVPGYVSEARGGAASRTRNNDMR